MKKRGEAVDGTWSLPPEVVARLEVVQQAIDPSDPVYRHAWLFAEWPERRSRRQLESWDAWREELDAQRRRAMEEVVQGGGFSDALRMAHVAESPRTVGVLLAMTYGDTYTGEVLPTLLGQDEKPAYELAAGFLWGRFSQAGWEWADGLHAEGWEPLAAARLLAVLPFDRGTWERADRLGADVAEKYWDIVRAFNPQLGTSDVEYAVDRLLQRRRPGRAVDLLAMALHEKVTVPSECLLQSLEAGAALSAEQTKQFLHEVWHDVADLFQELQSRSSVDEARLARLEFPYLTLLDGHQGAPRTLHRLLSQNPKLFVDLLCTVFKRADRSDEEREYSEQERSMARQAYRLLESWTTLPGLRGDGTIDAAALHEWVAEAKRLADSEGRLGIGDSRIGHLLANAPADVDGTWPCAAVRQLLESISSDAVERGFQIGVYNSRGVVTKSPYEGGGQERGLAEKFAGLAATYQIQCPRTAAVLLRLAEQYRREAAQEDEQAEWRD